KKRLISQLSPHSVFTLFLCNFFFTLSFSSFTLTSPSHRLSFTFLSFPLCHSFPNPNFHFVAPLRRILHLLHSDSPPTPMSLGPRSNRNSAASCSSLDGTTSSEVVIAEQEITSLA
ncbi:hypothetical protein V8G54_007538, partial [Vigna mungo]